MTDRIRAQRRLMNMRRLARVLAGERSNPPMLLMERLRSNARVLARATAAAELRAEAEAVFAACQGAREVHYRPEFTDDMVLAAATVAHSPELPTILFLVHDRGGGTHTHLRRLIRALTDRVNALILRGAAGRLHLTNRFCARGGLTFDMPEGQDALVRVLRAAGVERVDVHHVMGFECEAEGLLEALGLPFDYTLVDYHPVAHDPHLCGADGTFVGEKALEESGGIIRCAPLPVFQKADRRLAISRDLSARIQRLAPGSPVTCVNSIENPRPEDAPVAICPPGAGEPLRIAIVGNIQAHKGRAAVIETARLAAERRARIEFCVYGNIDLDEEDAHALSGVLLRFGRFETGSIIRLLRGNGHHLGWLPAQTPETWSYTLSDLMLAGLPLAASAIGAIPERCEGRPATWLLPHDAPAEAWLTLFEELRAHDLSLPPRLPEVVTPPGSDVYPDVYLQPMQENRYVACCDRSFLRAGVGGSGNSRCN